MAKIIIRRRVFFKGQCTLKGAYKYVFLLKIS